MIPEDRRVRATLLDQGHRYNSLEQVLQLGESDAKLAMQGNNDNADSFLQHVVLDRKREGSLEFEVLVLFP
jgi:hypothetical protein